MLVIIVKSNEVYKQLLTSTFANACIKYNIRFLHYVTTAQ